MFCKFPIQHIGLRFVLVDIVLPGHMTSFTCILAEVKFMDASYTHERYFCFTSSRGQFKLKGIILIIPKAKCFSCCCRLYCGRPGEDSEIPVLPPAEM